MKIAVTCENNEVFQHFGHTPEFAIFETEAGAIVNEKRYSCGDTGHGALAGLLSEEKIDLLICGGIGGGAINALTSFGIQVVGGAEGNVREVVQALLDGTLTVRENFHCNHHHHGGDHECGSHGHGEGHSCGGHGHSCGGGNCGH